MAEVLLSLSNIESWYGPVTVIRGISMDVREGSIVAILGANGAGKTTCLKTISGILNPRKGNIVFEGRNIERIAPDRVARMGIAHVPEGRETFPFLSTYENLMMGAYTRRDMRAIRNDLDLVLHYIPQLRDLQGRQAGSMSGGEQQMLVIGRALMSRPKLLLLDEPSLGLSPKLIGEIFELITRINKEQKITIVLVEQNAGIALSTSQFAYVLEVGRVVMEGPSEWLAQREDIKESYLGMKQAGARDERRWKKRKTWR